MVEKTPDIEIKSHRVCGFGAVQEVEIDFKTKTKSGFDHTILHVYPIWSIKDIIGCIEKYLEDPTKLTRERNICHGKAIIFHNTHDDRITLEFSDSEDPMETVHSIQFRTYILEEFVEVLKKYV